MCAHHIPASGKGGSAEAGGLHVQGAAAVELVPWPHADQAHEWAQSIQTDFGLPIQVSWTRLGDVSNLHYHTEVSLAAPAEALHVRSPTDVGIWFCNMRMQCASTAKRLVSVNALELRLCENSPIAGTVQGATLADTKCDSAPWLPGKWHLPWCPILSSQSGLQE